VYVPARADAIGPLPVVVVLHGHGGTARQAMRVSRMNELAEARGFLAVYPEGSSWMGTPWRSWNAGACCGYAMERQVDDIGFLRELLADLAQAYPVDPARVYLAGISNGAMLAYRAGCELADRIAAIAPIAGTLDRTTCRPSGPVSVIIFHGADDAHVPYAGGRGRHGRMDPPVAEAVRFWVERNGCEAAARRPARGAVIEEDYSGCAHNTGVKLYTVQGGGHRWFDRRRGDPLSATELMWEFFSRHPKGGKGWTVKRRPRRVRNGPRAGPALPQSSGRAAAG
jgi:polyhydroxybutyrate depolymerase